MKLLLIFNTRKSYRSDFIFDTILIVIYYMYSCYFFLLFRLWGGF